jgi:uncharacterized membrane protein YhaH (DUF805 family)
MTGMSLSPSPSSAKRLSRGPFALAAIVVYALSLASQALLSPPVTGRMSVVPFVVAQAVLIVLWVILHQRRLRDAGRTTGTTIGIALVYALQAVLLTLVTIFLGTPDENSNAPILNLFVLVFLLTFFSGNSMAAVQLWLAGLLVLLLLPAVVAVIFSIWAGTRPSVIQSTAP